MEEDFTNWEVPTILYVLDINGMVKIGITENWSIRQRRYERELKGLDFQLIKSYQFETKWQAELVEQVMKCRLKPWAVSSRHDWINLPIQPVLDCYAQTAEELEKEYDKHRDLHTMGNDRYDHYRQIAEMFFNE